MFVFLSAPKNYIKVGLWGKIVSCVLLSLINAIRLTFGPSHQCSGQLKATVLVVLDMRLDIKLYL